MEVNIEGCSESDSTVSTTSSQGSEHPDPDISSLPWEVLLEIFCHLDGKSLLICKRVCKGWKELVHHLEQKAKFWYDNCQKDIPSWIQFDLLDNMYPGHWKDQNRVNWEEIYKSWYFWSSWFANIITSPMTVRKLASGINGTSSVRVSGEWLFISSCEGRGKLSALRLNGTGGLIDLYVGGGAIEDFELVISDRHPYSNKKPSAELEEIFGSIEHNEIWLELRDCYIQLGKTYCNTLDKIQQKISHSYGYEVRLVTNRHCSSIILKKTCGKVNGPELMELELSSLCTRIVDFWTNTITVSAYTADQQLIVDAVSVNLRTQQASLTTSLGFRRELEHCKLYSWHGSLIVIYTSKGKLLIDHNGKENIYFTSIKKGRVTSVLFHANYFFLGTDRGILIMFKVENPEDCVKIAFNETHFEFLVCYEKIIHLAVAEPIHHKGKGPAIVCATPENIYLVSIPV